MWGFYWGSETAEMWHGTGRPPLCLLHCIYNILWWWWWEGDACLMNHKVFQWGIEESSAPTDHIYHKDVTSNGVIACNITECFSSFISSNKSIHFSYYFFFKMLVFRLISCQSWQTLFLRKRWSHLMSVHQWTLNGPLIPERNLLA